MCRMLWSYAHLSPCLKQQQTTNNKEQRTTTTTHNKLDVRDLGGHLDTTYRAWGRTLVARVLAVLRVAGWSLLYRWIIGVSFVFSAP